jgi:hypothetical protein
MSVVSPSQRLPWAAPRRSHVDIEVRIEIPLRVAERVSLTNRFYLCHISLSRLRLRCSDLHANAPRLALRLSG